MRAVLFTGAGGVTVDEVAAPRIQEPTDAVVRVTLTSICGSDLHLLSNKTPGMRPGGVIGHEFVGVVAAAGAEVRTVAEGDRVAGSFLIACGRCVHCRERRFNHCVHRRALGLGTLTGDLDGAQAEYVRVPIADVNLRSLQDHDHEGDEKALFIGDVLTTGFYAAARAELSAGETAVVIGGGPIGITTAVAALRRGASVHVVESDSRRAVLLHDRLKLNVLSVPPEAEAQVAAATDGIMADGAFDAVGSVPALKTAMRCTRPAGRVVVVGVYGAERYDLPLGMVWVRGLDIRFAGMTNVQAHWDEASSAMVRGEVDPTALITHRLPLDRAEEGYELFAAREALKVVLSP